MKACIYYDLDVVSSTDVEQARAVAGSDAVHVCMADAAWPATLPIDAGRIRPFRDLQIRALLMEQFEALQAAMPRLEWRGVDLLEAVRYDWLMAYQSAFHRAWALAELLKLYAPRRIHWVSAKAQSLAGLRVTARRAGVEFSTSFGAWDIARARVRESVEALKLALWNRRDGLRTAKVLRQLQSRPLNIGGEQPIVFIEYFPNSAKLAARLAKSLEAQADCRTLFVGGRRAVLETVTAAGRECRLLEEFLPAADRSTRAAQVELLRRFEQALSTLPEEHFRPQPEGPSCRDYLLPAMIRSGRAVILEAVQWAQQMTGMLQQLRPAALVTTTYSSTFGRAAALAAEQAQLPSIYVQHGIFPEDPYFAHFINRRIFVWGEYNRRAFLRAGIDDERICVVGAPNQDDIVRWVRGTSAADQPADSGTVQFLFLASRAGGSYVSTSVFERTLQSVADAVLALPQAELVVKLHPADRSGIAERMLAGQARAKVLSSGNSMELLSQCDVAIVTSSTTGLEACTLDKPLIVYNLTGFPDVVDYQAYEAAICIDREADLSGTIDRILHDQPLRDRLRAGRRRIVDDMLDGATGQANEKAARAILDTVANRCAAGTS